MSFIISPDPFQMSLHLGNYMFRNTFVQEMFNYIDL